MRYNIKDYHKGKCKKCKEIKMIYFGLCQECHSKVIEEAINRVREENPFIGDLK